MNKENNKYLYKDRKYNIDAYDSNWPNQFEIFASKIRKIFGDVQIEHIGSTAVPGIYGKSCIDILVILKDLKIVDEYIESMEKVGFEYAGQFLMASPRLFRVMKDNVLFANIHFFPIGHLHIKEMLGMRDYFMTHPEEVATYSKLKNELYSKYSNDYASYRKYKDEYMNNLKKRVLEGK